MKGNKTRKWLYGNLIELKNMVPSRPMMKKAMPPPRATTIDISVMMTMLFVVTFSCLCTGDGSGCGVTSGSLPSA